MLPSDIVQNIASFLPANNAKVVEHVWHPQLPASFYKSLVDRDGYRQTIVSRNTGIQYELTTRKQDGKYITTMTRAGLKHCECYHGTSWRNARAASNWLASVIAIGHHHTYKPFWVQ